MQSHGGGFLLGSCLEQTPFHAQISREIGAIVLSVDYLLGLLDKGSPLLSKTQKMSCMLYPTKKKKPGYQELRQAITHKLIESYNTKKEEGRDRISDPLSNSAPVTGGVKLDTSKIALSGFSSGGNLALEPALNVGANPPLVPTVWPSPFSLTHIHPIPLLLFYPSLDGRLLPSERTRPPGLPVIKGFWTELSDTLAPTYLSREEAPHPRASPALADILDSRLHEQARILLILPELDSLAEQSETWVKEVHEDGRGQHLRVERYKGMKHGWKQMPESWLGTPEKQTSVESFGIATEFVKRAWETGQVR
jgi:acetyl esterase/lipase